MGRQALSAAEPESDPGMATVLESLLEQRRSTQEPVDAIDDLIHHIHHVRYSAAEQFHQARQHGTVHLADFERTLGDLPLEASQVEFVANSSHLILQSAISLARDNRFLSSRRDLAPAVAAELDRQFEATSAEQRGVCAVRVVGAVRGPGLGDLAGWHASQDPSWPTECCVW